MMCMLCMFVYVCTYTYASTQGRVYMRRGQNIHPYTQHTHLEGYVVSQDISL